MSADSLAMMPWFPRDYIADTRHWSLLERGIYRELLDFQWLLGVLPEAELELCRLVACSESEFSLAWPRVSTKFVRLDSGGYQNRRLEEHRAKSLSLREARSKAGSKGGSKTQAKHQANPEANGVAKIKPPSPSPSPAIKEEDSRRGDKSPAKDLIWVVGVDLLTSAGEKNHSARSFLGKLCKDFGDDEVREAVGRAAAVAPADPKSWLQGALKTKNRSIEPPRAI